ncbi:DUF1302 domain-containing protein [Oleiharenicola lentus]|uniref:DUF1302 domain-containing protein n=1 Tax=Oleiharenicola lentus TaxID=2508720 RepID=UPI003F67AB63
MHSSKAIVTRLRVSAVAGLALALGLAPAARAFVFELGDAKGSFDTTLSFGGLYRLNEPEPQYYGLSSTFNGVPGQQRSVNADDGNLNYRKGIASLLAKANHDLQIDYKNAGLFVRGYYFNDFENADGDRNRTPLNSEARKLVARGGELLDAYVYFNPTVAGKAASLRVGRQVLSWGESTFIPNGVNSVNPIDVAKLRTPGSELKEALLPLNMVSGSLSLTDNLTAEAFYLLEWDRTRVDPPGTYFSTNDFVAKGGEKVYLGFGAIPDTSALGPIVRGPDNEPDTEGQYGVNLRYLAEKLNNTEFGLYYMNYHSRLPAISARTPTTPINGTAAAQVAGAGLGANATFTTGLATALGSAAAVPSAIQTLVGAALTNVSPLALPAALQPFYPTAQGAASQALQQQFFIAAATGNYLIEFPEDIHMTGVSFNTNLKGIALQGELSYRSNQPLQIDDVELLFAAISAINPTFGPNNQIGNYAGQLNTYIPGYTRHKVYTGQITATRVGRGILGADQSTLLVEAGFVNADLPAKGTLRYDGQGTFTGGNAAAMTATGNATAGSEPADAFADEFSWGYQAVARLDYNNAFAGVNVSPLLVFAHDVGGNTPLPLGNFRHGRKTITVGADFTFQNAWAFELRYVDFSGAGRYNLLGDRDYVSATLKYSF